MVHQKQSHSRRFYLLFYITLFDTPILHNKNRKFVHAKPSTTTTTTANKRKLPPSIPILPKDDTNANLEDDIHNGDYIGMDMDIEMDTDLDYTKTDDDNDDDDDVVDDDDDDIIQDDDFDAMDQLFFGTTTTSSSNSNSNNNKRDESEEQNSDTDQIDNIPDISDIFKDDDMPQDIATFVNEKLNSKESSTILQVPTQQRQQQSNNQHQYSSSTSTAKTNNNINNMYDIDMMPPLDLLHENIDSNNNRYESNNNSNSNINTPIKNHSKQNKFQKLAFQNWNSFPTSSSNYDDNNNDEEDDAKKHKNIHNHKTTIRNIANSIIHDSTNTVSKVLRGDVAGHVPTNIYGQTIHEEIAECQLHHPDDIDSKEEYDDFVLTESQTSFYVSGNGEEEEEEDKDSYDISNNGILKRKLYGGAQYHRLLQYYHKVFLTKPITQVSEEEISLLIHGISSSKHDGVDLLRTVAILSSQRMDALASGILRSLAKRIEFVLSRMWDIVEYTMVTRTLGLKFSYGVGYYGHDSHTSYGYHHGNAYHHSTSSSNHNGLQSTTLSMESLESLEQDLISFVKQSYDKFVKQKVQFAYRLASGDIDALMRFVNWDLAFSHGTVGDSLISPPSSSSSSLQSRIIYSEDDDEWDDYDDDYEENNDELGDLVGGVLDRGKDASTTLPNQSKSMIDCETDKLLMQVIKSVQETAPMNHITNTATSTSLQYTNAAVNTLVQHVTTRWRLEISRIATTKFNAFCLVAFHDEFGSFLRKEMDEYLNDHFREVR